MPSENLIVTYPTNDPAVVAAAPKLVDALVKNPEVAKGTALITAVIKEPGSEPMVVSTINSKPSDLLDFVKNVKPSDKKEDATTAAKKIVDTAKEIVSGKLGFPKLPSLIKSMIPQDKKKPSTVPSDYNSVAKTPEVKGVIVAPIGDKTVAPTRPVDGVLVMPVTPTGLISALPAISGSKRECFHSALWSFSLHA